MSLLHNSHRSRELAPLWEPRREVDRSFTRDIDDTEDDRVIAIGYCLGFHVFPRARAAAALWRLSDNTSTPRRGLRNGAVGKAQPPAGAAPQSSMTTKQLMETTITDASNAIWNAFDAPTSDEQWAGLEKAALALIDATKLNAVGDVLYAPCEGCHLQFSPGPVNQN